MLRTSPLFMISEKFARNSEVRDYDRKEVENS